MITLTRPARKALLGIASLVCIAALGACTSSAALSTTPSPVLDVTARDFSYTLNTRTPVAAGFVSFRLHNQGTVPHQANIARLHNGVTYAQFTKALRGNPMAALSLVDFLGGVNTIDPGMTGTVTQSLSAGHYVLLCFVETSQHVPHVAMGMIADFLVRGRGANPAPHAVGTVGLYSYGFDLPAHFARGLYKVVNRGGETHEMSIVRVAPGKTAQDVRHWLLASNPAGPPPFTDAGGVGGLDPGRVAYGAFDLRSGDYVALCYVPDDKTGQPHFAMGMFRAFHVA